MSSFHRNDSERPQDLPTVVHTPGMANELMRELAPLLAEDGIDIDNPDIADIAALQSALERAVERRNMLLFSPVGKVRELAVDALRHAVNTLLIGAPEVSSAVIDSIVPESPDGTKPEASACIGVSLGLLDGWLSGQDSDAPPGLGAATRVAKGLKIGDQVATDILVLARKGRAFDSLGPLTIRYGGKHVLIGGVLVLAGAVSEWANVTNTPFDTISLASIR